MMNYNFFVNKNLTMVLGLVLILAFWGCEDQNTDYNLEEYPVVQAYLIPGQAVDGIRVFKMSNYIDTTITGSGISDLQISLTVDSLRYILDEYADDPGTYYYGGDDLSIIPGAFCQLEFDYGGTTISSETTIPGVPENLELSKTTLSVSMGGWGGAGIEPIEVTWDNPGNDYFYMVATNIEENPTPVHEDLEEGDDLPLSFGTTPATHNLINIVPPQCRYYGTYQMVIFRVNPEFAELSQYTTTSTINLTEPYTNINNGKGIFTSFTSDTAYFEAVSSVK